MIRFLDLLSFGLEWGYVLVFYWMLRTFLPLRGNRVLGAAAFLLCGMLAPAVIYSNDLPGLLGVLGGFGAYVALFHRGRWMEKLSAVLVFCPVLIAVNYTTQDAGSRLFFRLAGPSEEWVDGWTEQKLLLSTAIHTGFMLLRLLFWTGAWQFLKKYLRQITSELTAGMWLVVDALMLSPFVAIFTIIFFMPEDPVIVYPICISSVFSGFGCIWLAAYICASVRTAYRAQELEMKQTYYRDRMKEEERVRGIYHDLKNHLLVLQARAGDGQEIRTSVRGLQEQISAYEEYCHTGNEFLDIILRDKTRAAQERGIELSAMLSLEDSAFLDPLDISTIFGNALDNAIEASEKLPDGRRAIIAKAARIRDMLVVSVENNALPEADALLRTTKKDESVHGFGIPNIRKAVERYGGQCSARAQEGRFLLKIMIPVP